MRRLFVLGIAGIIAAGCGGTVVFSGTAGPDGGAAGTAGTAGTAGNGGMGGTAGNGGMGGTAGNAGTGGTGGSGGGEGITGSHDLELDNVQPPNSYGSKSPSEGAAVRIDIRKIKGSGYEAVATPRWGDPTALSIDVSAKSVTLTGSIQIQGSGEASDEWTKLVLSRDAQGRLVGSISATGKETVSMGDVMDMLDVTSGGKIGPDVTAPELSSSPVSPHGPAGMLLPWDPVPLYVAEGVDQAQLESHASIEPVLAAGSGSGGTTNGPSGGPAQPGVEWQLSPPTSDKLGWVGATRATARFSDWSMDGGSFSLDVQPGVTDRAGHAAGAFNTMFSWLALGQPQPAVDFSSAQPASWGKVFFQQACPPNAVCTTQYSCESGACAVLGPYDNTGCGAPRAGFAGRLTSGAHVVVRYRVLIGPAYQDAGPWNYGFVPFSVDVATPGNPATYHSVQVDSGDYHALPNPIGNLGWTTDEKTLTLPGSTTSGIGFAIFAGSGPGDCSGGMVPPPVPTAVIVDSLTTE